MRWAARQKLQRGAPRTVDSVLDAICEEAVDYAENAVADAFGRYDAELREALHEMVEGSWTRRADAVAAELAPLVGCTRVAPVGDVVDAVLRALDLSGSDVDVLVLRQRVMRAAA